jgi:hypothetical protein
MKLLAAAAVGASILAQGGLISASPLKIIDIFEISTLGGMTFQISQVPNQRYSGAPKGPLAVAKAYAKFGVDAPDDLLSAIDQLLQQLGLLGSNASNATTPGM